MPSGFRYTHLTFLDVLEVVGIVHAHCVVLSNSSHLIVMRPPRAGIHTKGSVLTSHPKTGTVGGTELTGPPTSRLKWVEVD